MQAMSAMKIKQKSWTGLTDWIEFHTGNISNGNQAEELHRTHKLDEILCRQYQQ